jgi:ectoine hydroxylase-related dioxygenase (phytanoyl-CoA dioxygenase family)
MIAGMAHQIKQEVEKNGFTIIPDVFDQLAITSLQHAIANASVSGDAFRKTNDLFAIRRFLLEVPEIREKIFTPSLNFILKALFPNGCFSSKSIYFDKPGSSNWFVSYHQDLTISVDAKADLPGFGPWTVKPGQFAVQPPAQILESSYTTRIHLDDTDGNNGALRVIRGSHSNGINRLETLNLQNQEEVICEVPAGGVMIMKPLIFHASSRTVDERRRRVIHLEFCDQDLPGSLNWAEKIEVSNPV